MKVQAVAPTPPVLLPSYDADHPSFSARDYPLPIGHRGTPLPQIPSLMPRKTTKKAKATNPTTPEPVDRADVRKTALQAERLQNLPDEAKVRRIIQEAERALRERPEGISTSLAQYLFELQRYPPLTPEQEYRLAVEAQKGSRTALEALIKHNLRFVVAIARKHAADGVQLEDLVQEGNIGLMRAVRKFNPDIGVRFVSYAIWWIQQAILAGLARDQRSVRLPVNRATQLGQIRRASAKIKEDLGRQPTPEEISRYTGIPVHVVETLLMVSQTDVSLDTPASNGNDGTSALIERLHASSDLENLIERRSRNRYIAEALARLRPRDAQVLRLHFGIDGNREHTLEEIGAILGVTRERIRQVRDRALRELRTTYGEALKDYAGLRLGEDYEGDG